MWLQLVQVVDVLDFAAELDAEIGRDGDALESTEHILGFIDKSSVSAAT